MAKKDIIEERLAVAEAAVGRLLNAVRSTKVLRGRALARMKLVEQSLSCLNAVRLDR